MNGFPCVGKARRIPTPSCECCTAPAEWDVLVYTGRDTGYYYRLCYAHKVALVQNKEFAAVEQLRQENRNG